MVLFFNTKEAFAAKLMQWATLRKTKGTIQKSKFDKDLEKIKELIKLGLSVRKIIKLLEYTNHIAPTPILTKESYSILNGTWLHERLYWAKMPDI